MSNQVQCQSCGGYKIDGKIVRIDPSTGQVIKLNGCGLVVITIMLYFGAVQALWFLIFFLASIISPGAEVGMGTILLIALSSIFAPFLVVIPFYRGQSATQKRGYNLYMYHCNLCGYDWQWREGQTRPKVKVKPDLIAKGAKKLEEEEKSRKQQEDAAALYHLTHKK